MPIRGQAGPRQLETALVLAGGRAELELEGFKRFLRTRGARDIRVTCATAPRRLDYRIGGVERALDATVAFLEPEVTNLSQVTNFSQEVQRQLAGQREGGGVLGFLTEQPCGALSFHDIGGGWSCGVVTGGGRIDNGGW